MGKGGKERYIKSHVSEVMILFFFIKIKRKVKDTFISFHLPNFLFS